MLGVAVLENVKNQSIVLYTYDAATLLQNEAMKHPQLNMKKKQKLRYINRRKGKKPNISL